MLHRLLPIALALVPLTLAVPTLADHHKKPEKESSEAKEKEADKKDKDKEEKEAEAKLSVTTGSVTIAGEEIAYVATAGKLAQKSDSDLKTKAEVFYVAYTKGEKGDDGKAVADPSRPVTFCFNGGPGSCSVWLHLGMLGPKRVELPEDASFTPPPYGLTENEYSLLDVTDLVFIDPVGTGYSRPAKGEKRTQFHGLEEDLKSVGQFIHDYTTKNGRWSSPKFVLGESYGGLRAGGLSQLLQERYRMYLNGVVLVSAVLDFATLDFEDNNDLPYILFLPGYTATAWRHDALGDDLQAKSLEEVVAAAEDFAYGDYADALLHGASMPDEKRAEVTKEMSRLTGLSEDYLEDANLRVHLWRFAKELLRDRGQIIGRFDSRYAGPGLDDASENQDYDPSGAAVFGVFGGAMNAYLRDDLKYEDERVYEILTGSVRPWNYKPYVNRYVTTADRLAKAMTMNPHLHVFAALGYYDLATPAFAMEHTRDHALIRKDQRDRFETAYYEGGHMMYVHEPSLAKMREDLLKWYKKAVPSDSETAE